MGNEITVKLKCGIKELCDLLEDKGFKIVEKFTLDDTYFTPKELKLNEMSYREILGKAILLRDIAETMPKRRTIQLTFKNKQIDNNGDILKQSKIDCEILETESGKAFLEAIGYQRLMRIKENDIVYEKEGLKIAIKDILNGDKLIEIETVEKDENLNTVDKLKQQVNELNIPIDITDYFVKKAEIELEKIL